MTSLVLKPPTMHQQCIEVYLRIVSTLSEARANNHPDNRATKLWSWMRTARMFEVGNSLPYEITQSVLADLTRDLKHDARYYDEVVDDNPDMEEFERIMVAETAKQRLPEHRAFECMWLAYGYGNQVKKRTIEFDTGQFSNLSIVGHLVTPNDEVWSFVMGELRGSNTSALLYQEESIGGVWQHPSSFAAWLVPWVLEFIDNHGDLITEYTGLKKRRDFEKESKKLKLKRPVPPHYYLIKLANHHYEWRPKNRRSPGSISFELTHRYDRESHWRHLVKRGPGRPDPVMAEDLRSRGYRVFERLNLPPELEKKLLRKGHRAKRPDEWLAVKEIRIPAQHKIPYHRTDLEYRAASRSVTR